MASPAGEKVTAARPGHADFTGIRKYDREDVRDILERSSARETTMRVAVGAVCKEFLKALGITVVSQVTCIGGVAIDPAKVDRAKLGTDISDLNCYDAEAEAKMKAKIKEARKAGDTLGGIFEITVRGLPGRARQSHPVGPPSRRQARRRPDVHPGYQGRGDRCGL